MLWKVYHAFPALARKESTLVREVGEQRFFTKPAFLTSFSLSLLYFNVLSFGPVFISFLVSKGLSPTLISILRGIASGFGILATITYKILVDKLGPIRLGLWAIWIDVLVMGLACSSFFLYPLASLIILVVFVILSRWALWTFDIAQSEIFLEAFSQDVGEAAGVQSTLTNSMDLLSYIATIVWSQPRDFFIPSGMSFGCVVLGAILFTFFVKKERKHLFHRV